MARPDPVLERGLVRGLLVFEWAAAVWMVVVLAVDLSNEPALAQPVAAVGLVAAAVAFTAWSTWAVTRGPRRVLTTPALVVQGALALGLVVADQWAYGEGNVHSQSLGSVWPLAWALAVGIRSGWQGGLGAGFAVGLGSWLSDLAFVPGRWYGDRITGAMGGIVLYTLGGGVAGFVADRLRQAEKEIAVARAREEVARTLHDGVLQTLAVVQRRSDDADLVALARDQELELREYLFGASERERARRRAGGDPAGEGVEAALRGVAARAERQHGLRTQVVVAGELPAVADGTVGALRGAVAEALANAARHGGAAGAVVFVDPQDDGVLFCSVKDDGAGFDPVAVEEGVGLSRSVRGRTAEVGGRVEVVGNPGHGAEIRIWVPCR